MNAWLYNKGHDSIEWYIIQNFCFTDYFALKLLGAHAVLVISRWVAYVGNRILVARHAAF
jgi:hypothetical protein